MKKTVYFVSDVILNADSYPLLATYDLEAARKEAATEIEHHLTPSERKKHILTIEGFNIECEDGLSAEDAYETWLDECDEYPDPDFYEEIKP